MTLTKLTHAAAALGIAALTFCAVPAVAGTLYDRLAGACVVFPERHAITFKDGPNEQSWDADGTTVLDTRTPFIGKRKGVWDIRNGQYCADFGPQDNRRPVSWTCWNVEFSAPGRIAFVAPRGVWIAKRRVEGHFVAE